MSKRHNVTVPEYLDEIIREEADNQLKSMAQVIRDALLDYFSDDLAKRRARQETPAETEKEGTT